MPIPPRDPHRDEGRSSYGNPEPRENVGGHQPYGGGCQRHCREVGSGRLFPIPESEEDPDTPTVEDTLIVGGIADPSIGTFPPPAFNTHGKIEENSSVKDSVTSGVTLRKPGEGSTGVRFEGIAEKGTT